MEIISVYKAIESKAIAEVKDLTEDEKNLMANLIAFYQGRENANATIKESVVSIPDVKNDSILALIVGAAHTDGICQEFAPLKTPIVVMTPNALASDDKKGSLDYASSFQRKMNGKSVCNETYIDVINSIFHKKPKPALNYNWFRAKAELYFFTDKITRQVLGPPLPPNTGLPPYGFQPSDLKGQWISIDPTTIAIVDDENSGKGAKAVLFELIIWHENSKDQTKMWVKSALNGNALTRSEELNIEKLLVGALTEVKSKDKVPMTREESKGRINISAKTIAAIATTKNAVMQISLESI